MAHLAVAADGNRPHSECTGNMIVAKLPHDTFCQAYRIALNFARRTIFLATKVAM
jgi:hypothetical protein